MNLPDVPDHLWKFGEEQALRRRLARLLDLLDGALAEMPVEVERRPSGYCAWAFGAVGYRVNRESRSVMAFSRVGGLRVPRPKIDVEVFKPLNSRHWLYPLLAHAGIADTGPQRHLFVNDRERMRQEDWLTAAAWKRIRLDQRFRRLRTQLLPSALGLDRELMSIALRSRPFPHHQGVSNRLYTRVWQHEEAYRRVARENPRLLPLVSLAIREKKLRLAEDPVAGVRRLFLEGGVSPAGWRYLARHGAKIFMPTWRQMLCGCPFREAVQMMKALDAAGLPPPPPPAVVERFPALRRAPSDIVSLALRAGRDALARGGYLQFLADAELVMHWAHAENPVLDERQRHAGWSWALRRAVDWKRRKDLLDAAAPQAWTSIVGTFASPPYVIVSLDSVKLMVEEGLAMRNCLAGCVDSCRAGSSRFFSVRDGESGKRMAVFEVHVSDDGSGWILGDVRGPRNTSASRLVQEKAVALAQLYDTLDTTPRPLPIPQNEISRFAVPGDDGEGDLLMIIGPE